MDIDFKSKYININFDDLIGDKAIINSDQLYVTFKKDYFDQTMSNYKQFEILSKKLVELEDSCGYRRNEKNTKHIFVYGNDKQINDTRQAIKNIYIEQEKIFNNFYHYITFLSSNRDLFLPKKTNVEKRSFLSKLFDKKS